MFKPCPKCGFLVALIAGREASQRCPRCGSALVTESELLEMETASPAPAERVLAPRNEPALPGDAGPTAETTADETPAAAPDDATAPITDPDPAIDLADVTDAGVPAVAAEQPATHDAPHDGPSFARRGTRSRRRRPRWPWVATLVALALLLALQLLLAQRVELARDPTWRPMVVRACGLLRCTVPAWHQPQAFAMLARGVRPSGTRAGVLHVNATVRNDARWPQAPPVVVLSLSDVDGRVVGARAVTPAEYGHRAGAEVAPGDSLDIAFDVREPAARVESFDFQLQ